MGFFAGLSTNGPYAGYGLRTRRSRHNRTTTHSILSAAEIAAFAETAAGRRITTQIMDELTVAQEDRRKADYEQGLQMQLDRAALRAQINALAPAERIAALNSLPAGLRSVIENG